MSRTGPTGRCVASREALGMSPPSHVAVTSDQSLIADTVGAALAGARFVVTQVPWRTPSGLRVPAPRAEGSVDVGVLLCDLQPWPRLGEAQEMIRDLAIPWVVLTGVRRGPLWGAMFEAGAVGVLRSTSSLRQLRSALQRALGGEYLTRETEMSDLKRAWRSVERERRLAVTQVRSLTPRESAVLGLMHAGQSVNQIAEQAGVSEATVRSQVRAVLRKLDVNTQLAAVAAYETASTSHPAGL
jgi:DNA-binding NarL/FixJ family response regulator